MRVDYGSWLKNVLFWDTLLPAAVAVAPLVTRALFPALREVTEAVAVLLPAFAFLFRMYAGRRRIAASRCSRRLKRAQFCVFVIGLLPLALLESFFILSALVPGGLLVGRGDSLGFGILVSVYLAVMVFAMYPGRVAEDATFPRE